MGIEENKVKTVTNKSEIENTTIAAILSSKT